MTQRNGKPEEPINNYGDRVCDQFGQVTLRLQPEGTYLVNRSQRRSYWIHRRSHFFAFVEPSLPIQTTAHLARADIIDRTQAGSVERKSPEAVNPKGCRATISLVAHLSKPNCVFDRVKQSDRIETICPSGLQISKLLVRVRSV